MYKDYLNVMTEYILKMKIIIEIKSDDDIPIRNININSF